jgi:hypothetical protein
MMLAQQQLHSRAAFASGRRAGPCRRPASVVCLASKHDDLRTAVLSAAVATSLVRAVRPEAQHVVAQQHTHS